MTPKILPAPSVLAWAEKLKATKNPFYAPNPSPEKKNSLHYVVAGAIAAASFNAVVTDKMVPKKWHIPTHAGLAIASTLLPSHPMSAAVGGAMFYAAITEPYYAFIKSSLLASVKDAIK